MRGEWTRVSVHRAAPPAQIAIKNSLGGFRVSYFETGEPVRGLCLRYNFLEDLSHALRVKNFTHRKTSASLSSLRSPFRVRLLVK